MEQKICDYVKTCPEPTFFHNPDDQALQEAHEEIKRTLEEATETITIEVDLRLFRRAEKALGAIGWTVEEALLLFLYAVSTSPEDLMASRDHRAFGGFSLGSVTTWLQFCHDTDYIRYFLPMSGSSWYYGTYGDFQIERNVDFIEQLVQENNLDERGYLIYHAVGTNDAVKSQSLMMADEMLSRSDTFTLDHYVFYQKDGGYHDFDAVQEYMYNALPLFFRQ